MKKTFLIFGFIGALCATNGYSDGNQSAVVVYTCPDECTITDDTMSCVQPNGEDCGKSVANMFVPQNPGQTLNMPLMVQRTSVQPSLRASIEPVSARAASEPVAARAATRSRGSSKPTSNKPQGPDKAAGGSGYITIDCPTGCSVRCSTLGGYGSCWCEDSNGNKCQERSTSTAPTK